MKNWLPHDLDGMAPADVARELFGADISETSSWALRRQDGSTFCWNDRRLGTEWRATHGYLIALHEVSTPQQAREFATRNKITLFESGGLYFKHHAELLIRCNNMPFQEALRGDEDLYRMRTTAGVEAGVGYSSLLFRRLVSGPALEMNDRIPKPETLATLVLRGVEREEVSATAEIMLYHLRKRFAGVRFGFWPLPELHLAPALEEVETSAVTQQNALTDSVPDTTRPEAVAFFNRAEESEAITAFLYFYRVLEACFEDVLKQEISSWRSDTSIDELGLMTRFRTIQQREDVSALRKIIGQIVDQRLLDGAHNEGLIAQASADALTDRIYLRRNSIAHGRRGQHDSVLVPFCFALNNERQHISWRNLMKELALMALHRWILAAR